MRRSENPLRASEARRAGFERAVAKQREEILVGAIISRETVEEQRNLLMHLSKPLSSDAATKLSKAMKDPMLAHLLDILRFYIGQRQ